jgi:hypothetical protein
VITKGADVYNSVMSKTSEALNKVKKDKDIMGDFSFDDDDLENLEDEEENSNDKND